MALDSPTSFEEDDFFAGYDAEQGLSMSALELDTAQAQPSPEQLAHWARFRRPVASVIAALTLFSIVALERHGAHRALLRRELVAHYGAAMPAPMVATTTTWSTRAPNAIVAAIPGPRTSAPGAEVQAESLAGPIACTAEPSLASTAVAAALQRARSSATFSELFAPDSSMVSAFLSMLTAMCLRPVRSKAALAHHSHR